MREPTPNEWERACSALAALVRAEYPEGLSLTEIASRWGRDPLSAALTSEQIAALAVVERQDESK